MIFHNWKYKMLAMVVSLILCLYVNSERNPHTQRTYTLQVRTVGVPRGYVAELDTLKVTVSVDGLKAIVDTLAREDVEARVELGKVQPSKKLVQVSVPVLVRLPRAVENDLTVLSAPNVVRVRLEALEERRMPVEVSFASEPPLGYSYGSPTLTPDAVTISGRASQLASISKTMLSLSGDPSGSSSEEYYDVLPIDATGNVVSGVSVRPTRVRAKLDMVEIPSTKAVLVSPEFSGEPQFPFRVARYTVTPSSVNLEGKPSALNGLSCVSTDKVALEGAEATVTREVALRVPPGVKTGKTKTVKVTVYIGTE